MAGGSATSIVVVAAGAILAFAIMTIPDQHGWDLQTIGVILMIVGTVGAFFPIVGFVVGAGPCRHRMTVDDERGDVVRRDDTHG